MCLPLLRALFSNTSAAPCQGRGGKPRGRRRVADKELVMMAIADKDIPVCAPPDPAPRTPKFKFPPLACDCHAHICGPQAVYKYIPERIYSPPDALLADYRR